MPGLCGRKTWMLNLPAATYSRAMQGYRDEIDMKWHLESKACPVEISMLSNNVQMV
jgi:hypothetical protein